MSAPPPLQLVLRTKESVFSQVVVAGAPVCGRALPTTPAPVDVTLKRDFDASSGLCATSPDGRLVAVTSKENVEIYDVADAASAPVLKCTVAQEGVVCASFSPLGDFLLTWHRKKAEEGAFASYLVASITHASLGI
jgi:hypothetical protein